MTEMSMIERVARAIAKGEYGDNVDDVWPTCVDEARAAIEAVRLHLEELKASPPYPYFWPDHGHQILPKIDTILKDAQQ